MRGKLKMETAKNQLLINFSEAPELGKIRLSKYPSVEANWKLSRDILLELNKKLADEFGTDDSFAVLTAGSYGRMDASKNSDLDFMLIHNGHIAEGEKKIEFIREVADQMGLGMPNPQGAFSKPRMIEDLTSNIGSKEDDLHSMAQRLLIIMESRAIYNDDYFQTITGKILRKYFRLVNEEPNKEALVLLNDLIRYFRAICVNVEFNFWQDVKEKWSIRNVKLGHSRILIYAGLLFLILNSSTRGNNKESYIHKRLKLTPLERIHSVYQDNNDYNFERVIGAYNNFLFKLSEENARKDLQSLEYDMRYESNYYAELKSNSQFLQAELTQFILRNRKNWSSKIFEYLIF